MAARTLAALAIVVWLVGCATTGGPGNQPDPNAPPQAGGPQRPGVTPGQRAASALEGALMGAVIGGQMGPIGMAVGAASALIYGAVTGKVPFQSGPSTYGGGGYGGGPSERDREDALEHEIEQEMARQASLETEIEDELLRQEELLREIDRDDTLGAIDEPPLDSADPVPAEAALDPAGADPRSAPSAPRDRNLPPIVFDEEQVEIRKGTWDNDEDLDVVKRSLDADRDGAPEQVRYVDARTGGMVYKEQDRDYDGQIDAWQSYQGGQVDARQLDENDDGAPDVWEHYEGGRMISREVDRDGDGTRDAFFDFEGGALVEERHDTNGDGRIDLVVTYSNKVRVRAEEDTSHDGRIDTWTTYQVAGSDEIVLRIERDKNGDGRPNLFEDYQPNAEGKAQIVRREEDVNADGDIDVTSHYENGKLVRREVTDPGLVPL